MCNVLLTFGKLVLKCITKIPICGGWCDTTVSPEITALRQFSNENTVPRPCLDRGHVCRTFWEHNAVCRMAGGLGLPCADRNRARVMITACVFSSVGWLLMLVSVSGLAQHDAVVKALPWATASVEEAWGEATFRIGILRRTHHVDISHGGVSYAEDGGHGWFDGDACSRPNSVMQYSEPPLNQSCASCGDAAGQISFFVAVSLLTQIVQVATDLQRATPYGDVNCQRAMGILTSSYGLFSGMRSMGDFADSCWREQPARFELIDSDGQVELSSDVEWQPGVGYLCMLVGVLLKSVDVLCHLLVPTPAPKRRPLAPGERFGKLAEYLQATCPEPTRVGRPVSGDKSSAEVATSKSYVPEA